MVDSEHGMGTELPSAAFLVQRALVTVDADPRITSFFMMASFL